LDELERTMLDNFKRLGYPLMNGSCWEPSIVRHFYELAGVRSDKNKWKDVLAAWDLIKKHRFDEVLFVMRMVLTGKIPFYKGKRRPYDFLWFANHYSHARVLAEETLLATSVAKDETADRHSILAPWSYESTDWHGMADSWNGDWLTCLHEDDEHIPAYMDDGIEACYLCGCPKDWKPKGQTYDKPPVSAAPPSGSLESRRDAEVTSVECSHPLNADCGWKECRKRFHSKSRLDRFCSTECEGKFKANQAELKAKYSPNSDEQSKNNLAAFLEGR
jgi:hypothetical protein